LPISILKWWMKNKFFIMATKQGSTYGGTHYIVRVVRRCARYGIVKYFSYRGVLYRKKCSCGKALFDLGRFPSYRGFDLGGFTVLFWNFSGKSTLMQCQSKINCEYSFVMNLIKLHFLEAITKDLYDFVAIPTLIKISSETKQPFFSLSVLHT
jgi:hypothetical protein